MQPQLPIIKDPSNIDATQLQQSSEIGFCYVKLPNSAKLILRQLLAELGLEQHFHKMTAELADSFSGYNK